MADKFYQFHYAEMNGFDVINLGILNGHFKKSVTRKELIDCTREILEKPDARIVISHISKLTSSDFEKLTEKKYSFDDKKRNHTLPAKE